MKRWYALVAGLLLVCCLGGCSPTDKTAAPTPLTEEELAFFNGTEFFNREDEDAMTGINIRNQFLTSTYDNAKEIDLFELFYAGTGVNEPITDAEILAVMEKLDMGTDIERLPCPLTKLSVSALDSVLEKHMGLTLADTAQIGLENFTYLPAYKAYYHLHGDTNYRTFTQFSKGERTGDRLRLFHSDGIDKVLTLQSKDGGYLFVSNQLVEKAS